MFVVQGDSVIFDSKDFVYYVWLVRWKMMELHFHRQALAVYEFHLSKKEKRDLLIDRSFSLTCNRDKR
jgi:hypothetical protein